MGAPVRTLSTPPTQPASPLQTRKTGTVRPLGAFGRNVNPSPLRPVKNLPIDCIHLPHICGNYIIIKNNRQEGH